MYIVHRDKIWSESDREIKRKRIEKKKKKVIYPMACKQSLRQGVKVTEGEKRNTERIEKEGKESNIPNDM